MPGAKLRKAPDIMHDERMEGGGPPLKQNPSTGKRRADEARARRERGTNQREGEYEGGARRPHQGRARWGPNTDQRVVPRRGKKPRAKRSYRLQSVKV